MSRASTSAPPPVAATVRQGLLPLALALAAGLAVALLFDTVLDQALLDRTEASLATGLERLQPDLDAILSASQDPGPRVLSAARLFGARVTLIAPDGRVLADSDVDQARLGSVENHAGRPEVRAAREKGTGVDRRRSATVASPFVYIARRIWGGHVVRLAAREDELVAAEAPFLRKANTLSVAVGLLVGALLLLTRRRHASELDLVRSAVVAAARGEAPQAPPPVSDATAAVLAEVRRFSDLVRATGEGQRRQLAVGRAVFDAVPLGLLVVDRDLSTVEGNGRLSTLLGLGIEPPRPGTHALELLRDVDFERLLERAASAPAGTRLEGSLPSRRLALTALSLGADAPSGAAAALVVLAPVPEEGAPRGA